MPSRSTRIFISYARANSEVALKLAKDLKIAGADAWLDQLDIPPGDRWDQAVERALEQSECLIIVLTPSSVASINVMDELAYALDENKSVVPVLFEHCKVPLRIRRLHFIDFTDDYTASLNKLLNALKIAPMPYRDVSEEVLQRTLPKRSRESDPDPVIELALREKSRDVEGKTQFQPNWSLLRSPLQEKSQTWRAETIMHGLYKRVIRIFLTHNIYLLEVNCSRWWMSEHVVKCNGEVVGESSEDRAFYQFFFRVNDGPEQYGAHVEFSVAHVLARSIRYVRLEVGGHELYCEGKPPSPASC